MESMEHWKLLVLAKQLISVCCCSAPIRIQIFRLTSCHGIAVITALGMPIRTLRIHNRSVDPEAMKILGDNRAESKVNGTMS